MKQLYFYTLDENKNPIPASAQTFEYDYKHFEERKRVGWTKVGAYEVSTVFLGIDHNFIGDGLPILFETMIHQGDSFLDMYQWRYRTWREAEKGHAAIVKLLKEGALPDVSSNPSN